MCTAVPPLRQHRSPSLRDAQVVRSVSLLVSPTTAHVLEPDSVRAAADRLKRAPGWQKLLARLGAIRAPGHLSAHGIDVARATVSIQGLSYQAAQYLSKVAAAESYVTHGARIDAPTAAPITVSANVAGITRTRSLSHPVFEAAFLGAPMFSVRIFQPETTRALSVLLMLHDLLNPDAPGHAGANVSPTQKPGLIHAQQVHGGIYNLPYGLESAIRIAALLGMGKNPLILLRRSKSSSEARA